MPRPPLPEKRKAVREMISHMLVGLVLVIKGIDKAGHFSLHPFTVIFLFAAGAFIVLGAAFHQRIGKRVANFTAMFRIAEGLALFLVGFVLLERSVRLPYFLFFAGVINIGLGVFEFFTDDAAKKRLRPVLLAVMGVLFVIAALVFAAFNFYNSGNTWAYIISGVFAAVGSLMLLFRKKAAA